MKLIKPSFEIIEPTSYDLDGMYKHIELCGRTCYKSTDKITPESAMPFVDRMCKSQHYAMLEHGTVYLKASNPIGWVLSHYHHNKYSTYKCLENGDEIVTTNFRVIVENNWIEDLKYMCEPTKYHAKRYTVRYVASIHFYKDCTRHRVFSWAIESTRYCNYFKEKFGHSVSFIYPCWLKPEEVEEFEQDLATIESIYFKWIEKGWQAQQAATFLPQATKAEVIMTGFEEDWKHFFDLRALGTTGAPHPQVQELAKPLMKEFINRGYLKATNEEV